MPVVFLSPAHVLTPTSPPRAHSFRCFDDPVFDERKGETARYHVQDPRITADVEAFLKDASNDGAFFGHSVPLDTPGRVVAGRANTGWVRQGSAYDALILETQGWDTHFLETWIATILLKERIGYNVAVLQMPGAGDTFGRMAPTEKNRPVHFNVEVWPNAKVTQLTKWEATTQNAGLLGYIGRDGLYTTKKFADEQAQQGTFLEYWRSLTLDSVVQPLSYSPSPIFNASLLGNCFADAGGGAAGAEACTTCKTGTKHLCNNGTFVSPACEANGGPASNNCGVITMMDPELGGPGIIQQVTTNLNLSYQLNFVGLKRLEEHVLQREAAGDPVLFYHWDPDLFHQLNPGKFVRVMLPESTEACTKRGTGDPTGGIDCDFSVEPLTKFRPKNLETTAGTAATKFFHNMVVSNAMQTELLQMYGKVGAGDGTDHFQAACAWVKANPAVWKGWIEPWTPPDKITKSDVRPEYFYVAVALGTLVAAVLLWRGGKRLWKTHLRARPQVMISYRHTDGEFANQLVVALRTTGYRVWIDTAITPGKDWRQDIALAIQSSIAVVFIVSPGSVTSKYCKEELYYASAVRKPVFPVVLKEAFTDLRGGVKTILQRIQWIQFPNFDEGFAQLREHLAKTAKQARKDKKQGISKDKRSEGAAWMTAERASGPGGTCGSIAAAAAASTAAAAAVITADAYVCFHPSDTELAHSINELLSERKLRCVLANQPVSVLQGDGDDDTEGERQKGGSSRRKLKSHGSAVSILADNFIEENAKASECASVFVFVLSAASIMSEQCGEELHAAYESDKPMLVVTGAPPAEVPGLLALRGSMSMMIMAASHDTISFSAPSDEQATGRALAVVFTLLSTGGKTRARVPSRSQHSPRLLSRKPHLKRPSLLSIGRTTSSMDLGILKVRALRRDASLRLEPETIPGSASATVKDPVGSSALEGALEAATAED